MPHLIRGTEYLKRYDGFKLIGRETDLARISSILMRKKANSLLLVGPGGVGCTALCLGLEASKQNPETAFDIVSKRLFWLDTDQLFSCGDSQEINKKFQKSLDTLWKTPDSILVIEDTRDFIEAARNSGNSHFINALSLAVKSNKTQVILEVRDSDLDHVLKWHSDLKEAYTLYDVKEPVGDMLLEIVNGIVTNLTKHHGIKISQDAVKTAIDLTSKYRSDDMGIGRAQPERAITLLDRALATYRLNAHKKHPRITELEKQLNSTTDAVIQQALYSEIDQFSRIWADKQEQVKTIYRLQREGEVAVITLEEELEEQLRVEKERRDVSSEETTQRPNFSAMLVRGGFESDTVTSIRQRIAKFNQEIRTNRLKYEQLTSEINSELELTKDIVLSEFSTVSGIPATKLNEDELIILRNLENTMSKRIFGQNNVVSHVTNAVKIAKIGRRNKDKPLASFMFLGPSGVGKTEIAKALTEALTGDEKTLTRFDMSEYMEKHAVAKLIGAPPGYEGFEAGGILTNAARRNPARIYLFDEIEKAHPDVFNIFLQILSDGRLTDNVGRVCTFDESIIVMTTNIGQPHFLNTEISFEDAEELAKEELENTYRSEFLNRFAGRQNILCFDRLRLDSITKIIRREINDLEKTYSTGGITIEFTDEQLDLFCRSQYNPKLGARGLPGFLQTHLEPKIVNTLLDNPGIQGRFNIMYDTHKCNFNIEFKEV
jgi:ATP-dependent Clp protease ATP-binding subunit ClpB